MRVTTAISTGLVALASTPALHAQATFLQIDGFNLYASVTPADGVTMFNENFTGELRLYTEPDATFALVELDPEPTNFVSPLCASGGDCATIEILVDVDAGAITSGSVTVDDGTNVFTGTVDPGSTLFDAATADIGFISVGSAASFSDVDPAAEFFDFLIGDRWGLNNGSHTFDIDAEEILEMPLTGDPDQLISDGVGADVRIFCDPCGEVVTEVCPCELSGDDEVNISDLLAFLGAYFPVLGDAVPAGEFPDLDANGAITVGDLLAFLGCWFSATRGNPCP